MCDSYDDCGDGSDEEQGCDNSQYSKDREMHHCTWNMYKFILDIHYTSKSKILRI